MNFIDSILEYKKKEVEKKKKIKIKKREYPILDFKKAITRGNRIKLIAEIKRKSPSAGIIRDDFHPLKIADEYKEAGVSAISVLTDRKFFGGSLDYISRIKKRINIPVIAKDFFIDEYQILEAFSYGADAILLIASVLEDDIICDFLHLTRKLGIDAIVEVHTEEEVRRVLRKKADIIGINNRNLKTFKVDITTTTRLIKLIPDDKIVVSESGIKRYAQVKYLADARYSGVDAILVGEELMRSENIRQKISDLLYG